MTFILLLHHLSSDATRKAMLTHSLQFMFILFY